MRPKPKQPKPMQTRGIPYVYMPMGEAGMNWDPEPMGPPRTVYESVPISDADLRHKLSGNPPGPDGEGFRRT